MQIIQLIFFLKQFQVRNWLIWPLRCLDTDCLGVYGIFNLYEAEILR